MNKAGSLPSSGVMLSLRFKQYYEPLRLPSPDAVLSFPYTRHSAVSLPPTMDLQHWATSLPIHADPSTPGVNMRHFRCSSAHPTAFPLRPQSRLLHSFTRLHTGSLSLRPASLLFENSRHRVTAMPLPHTTGAHGQLPRRDFNPLDLLLLLRTDATL